MAKRRRYQFLKLIASGGFGDVYLCKEINPNGIDRLVAVKLLKSQWSDNKEIVSRLQDEARLLALLRHRNIINVFDLTSLHGRAAIIMEYLEGIDLSLIISIMKSSGKRTPLRISLEICAAAAAALDAAYNQPPFPGENPLKVIHRDIKPSNIMLDVEGMVKVLDFGVAYSKFEHRASETAELQFGSLEYMAPERLIFEPETPSTDLYSLGLTLFECILGEPFGKTSPKEEKHTLMVEDRLRKLATSLRVPEPFKKEILSLLAGALTYKPQHRISAVEFSQRSRNLARNIKGIELIAWAEKAIPVLKKSVPASAQEGSLRGRYIEEDIAPVEEVNDDETEIRSKKIQPANDSKLSFMDVGPLVEDEDGGTELFDNSDKTAKISDARNSYFDQEETIDIGEDKVNPSTQKHDRDATAEIEDTFVGGDFPIDPYEDSIESAIVRPVTFQEPDTPKSRSKKGLVLGLIFMMIASVCALIFRDSIITLLNPPPPVEPKPAVKKVIQPVKPEPVEIEEPPEDAVVFFSNRDDVKKIRISCDGQKAKSRKGALNFLEVDAANECKLQIIKKNRKRILVTVKNVKRGRYECLADEKEVCAREEK
ncbi:MAG: serine/threonine-protein kinase [Myxococcota bacterium]|nr:serine/threonine-protein kinase [Myxococcota bacterium]